MIQVAPGTKVHLACRPVSMRYGFDGLCAKAASVLALDPFSGTAVPQMSSEENHLISLPFWHGFVRGAGEQGGEVAALEQVEVQEAQDVLQ